MLGESAEVETAIPIKDDLSLVRTSSDRETVRYHLTKAGSIIGFLNLRYNPNLKEVVVGAVKIIPRVLRGQGYGTAIYETIPKLPPPIPGEYTFVSSQALMSDATHLWESLVRHGKAIKQGDRFVMRPQTTTELPSAK